MIGTCPHVGASGSQSPPPAPAASTGATGGSSAWGLGGEAASSGRRARRRSMVFARSALSHQVWMMVSRNAAGRERREAVALADLVGELGVDGGGTLDAGHVLLGELELHRVEAHVGMTLAGCGTLVHILTNLTRTGISPPWRMAQSRQTQAA
jgi:hypothetical protein